MSGVSPAAFSISPASSAVNLILSRTVPSLSRVKKWGEGAALSAIRLLLLSSSLDPRLGLDPVEQVHDLLGVHVDLHRGPFRAGAEDLAVLGQLLFELRALLAGSGVDAVGGAERLGAVSEVLAVLLLAAVEGEFGDFLVQQSPLGAGRPVRALEDDLHVDLVGVLAERADQEFRLHVVDGLE